MGRFAEIEPEQKEIATDPLVACHFIDLVR